MGLQKRCGAMGIVLPSLGVDAAAYGSESTEVLVDLGRCRVEVAGRLAGVLEGNAKEPRPGGDSGDGDGPPGGPWPGP